MNKYLEQLVELSNTDRVIDEFGPRIEKIEQALKEAVEAQNDIQNKITTMEDEVKEAEVKKSQHELHLAELSDKLQDISKKTNSVKTEKEQKALQLEEEICKEQCDFANDEIERLDNLVESKATFMEEAKTELEDATAKVEETRTAISSQMEEIEKERASVYQAKQELVGKMSQKILTFYEKIRKWARNTAVVPVKKQACYGCFMKINDKTYASVIKSEDIVTCPHCGRILYKEVVEAQS